MAPETIARTSAWQPSRYTSFDCDTNPYTGARGPGEYSRKAEANVDGACETGATLDVKLSWRQRLRYFTWTWFTLTMATGGIAAVLFNVPNTLRFRGLDAIGAAFMLLGICMFLMNCILMSLRFYYWPKVFRGSFVHPTESLFIPAIVISFCIIITNVTQYGLASNKVGDWLTVVVDVLYWIYIALAIVFSSGIYLLMWSTQSFTIAQMTPVWIFPAYPLLITGPLAGILSNPAVGRVGDSALRIVVSGFIIQGIGFMVSLTVYSAYLYRLMTQKLPAESLRPAMFISVGPSGFTIVALISMSDNFAAIMPAASPGFMGDGALAGQVTRIVAAWMGLWLWGLALWFFIVSVAAHWRCVSKHSMGFAMTWNSYVFPNTSLVLATFAVAKALGDNRAIEILGAAMTVTLVVVWAFIMVMAVRAVVRKQILWPEKQDEVEALLRDEVGKV